MVYRVYSEKKQNLEAGALKADLFVTLGITAENVRIINRYDAEGLSGDDFKKAIPAVFSEPPVDDVFFELEADSSMFAVEFLPGQFDQRADSAASCVSMLCGCDRPAVKYAKIYAVGGLTESELARVKNYVINPVEARECGFAEYGTLSESYPVPEETAVLNGFTERVPSELIAEYGLAMDEDDVRFCQNYFISENRQPTIAEVRIIDTYWSDHCRHTTFGTIIDRADIAPDYIKKVYDEYLRHSGGRPVTLMNIATAAVKKLKKDGLLPDLDESEEVNACSVKIKARVNGADEDWLLMFKNETHNHPTEIEPFGGAATCLGGAIRDPLSGRAYVYQAMRVSGAADPLTPFEQTIKGKLPQRKITTTAAAGYSSYGNQIGLATGEVTEIYHPGYAAKRMELGAVIGACRAGNVVRESPAPGDAVLLLGGRTGRDGCGGATGSSKSHSGESVLKCGAEVQKGNPPEERKIQRLFRNPEVSRLIKRCNDFGAGGISVAVGELADGLEIDLSAVLKKYEGLNATELAISESQERMAVVVSRDNLDRFILLADRENLECKPIAVVTDEKRVKMRFNGNVVCDLTREFLNSNGAEKHAAVRVNRPEISYCGIFTDWEQMVTDLNVCSQKGLKSRFDSTVGASSVLMPLGGITQNTPAQAMAAKLPVIGELPCVTDTASIMAWGGNPALTEKSPFHGAVLAVIESIAKIVAAGGSHAKCRLSFQEYFGRLGDDPARWGKPFAALLGAYLAQTALGIAAIGGKDSMSGSFSDGDNNIDVPATLISFAVSAADADKIISAEFKAAGNGVYYAAPDYDDNLLPDFESVKRVFAVIEREITSGNAKSVWSLSVGGIAEAVFKMSLGNKIGVNLYRLTQENLFAARYGGFVIEAGNNIPEAEKIGETISGYVINNGGEIINTADLERKWAEKLEPVFRNTVYDSETREQPAIIAYKSAGNLIRFTGKKIASPRVLIPAFPGTNGEYDMAGAFARAGGTSDIFVVRNLTRGAVAESVNDFAKRVRNSQIIALSGGFSAGDEPEGSGKFITAFMQNAVIKKAVLDLLYKRDGLILGICNGFQALIKLGLLPDGDIKPLTSDSPTLTFNEIGRHVSQMVNTLICTDKSPWLSKCKVGEVYTIPVSHGEGRFTAPKTTIARLIENGQIASQYADLSGKPSMEFEYNPNGSDYAIESVISPDGRVLGKMGHAERFSDNCFANIAGNKEMPLFSAGVGYFA